MILGKKIQTYAALLLFTAGCGTMAGNPRKPTDGEDDDTAVIILADFIIPTMK